MLLSKLLSTSSSLCPVRLVQLLEPAVFAPTPRPFPTGLPLLGVVSTPSTQFLRKRDTFFWNISQPFGQDLFLPRAAVPDLQGRSARGGRARATGRKSPTMVVRACTHTCEKIPSWLTFLQEWPEETSGRASGERRLIPPWDGTSSVSIKPVCTEASWDMSLVPEQVSGYLFQSQFCQLPARQISQPL